MANVKLNKHGFAGVRKRTTPQHWRKPYYARCAIKAGAYAYSKNFATVEEAAEAYKILKRQNIVASDPNPENIEPSPEPLD